MTTKLGKLSDDVVTLKQVARLKGHTSYVNCMIVFSPILITASGDHKIRFYNSNNYNVPIHTIRDFFSGVLWMIQFSRTRNVCRFYACGDDKRIRGYEFSITVDGRIGNCSLIMELETPSYAFILLKLTNTLMLSVIAQSRLRVVDVEKKCFFKILSLAKDGFYAASGLELSKKNKDHFYFGMRHSSQIVKYDYVKERDVWRVPVDSTTPSCFHVDFKNGKEVLISVCSKKASFIDEDVKTGIRFMNGSTGTTINSLQMKEPCPDVLFLFKENFLIFGDSDGRLGMLYVELSDEDVVTKLLLNPKNIHAKKRMLQLCLLEESESGVKILSSAYDKNCIITSFQSHLFLKVKDIDELERVDYVKDKYMAEVRIKIYSVQFELNKVFLML